MGQKVYPTGFRLGITENWRSRWFAEKDYAKTLGNDGLSSCLLAASAPLMAFRGLDSTQQEPTKQSVLYAHWVRISRKTSSACTTPQLPRTY